MGLVRGICFGTTREPLGYGCVGLSFSECRLSEDPNTVIFSLRASHSFAVFLVFLVRDVHERSAEPVKKLETHSSHLII